MLVLVAFLLTGCGSRDGADEDGVSTREDQLHRGVNASVADLQGVVHFLNNDNPWCTGSLIAPQFVLAAAHCTEAAIIPGCEPTEGCYSRFSVRIPNPVGDPSVAGNAQIINVDRIDVHPMYRKVCEGTPDHNNCDPATLKELGPYCNVIRECFYRGADCFGQHIEHDLALYHLEHPPVGVKPIPVIVSAPSDSWPGPGAISKDISPPGTDFRTYPWPRLKKFFDGYVDVEQTDIWGNKKVVSQWKGLPRVTIVGFGDGSHEWSHSPLVRNRDMGIARVVGTSRVNPYRDGCSGGSSKKTVPMLSIKRKSEHDAFAEKGDSGGPILIGPGDGIPGSSIQPTALPITDASLFGLGQDRYLVGVLNGGAMDAIPGSICSQACEVTISPCDQDSDCPGSRNCMYATQIRACQFNPDCKGVSRACDVDHIPCAENADCPGNRRCVARTACKDGQTCVDTTNGVGRCGQNCTNDSDCSNSNGRVTVCYGRPASSGPKVCRFNDSLYAPTYTAVNGDWIIERLYDLDGDGIPNDKDLCVLLPMDSKDPAHKSNCNELVESEREATKLADACDPVPCPKSKAVENFYVSLHELPTNEGEGVSGIKRSVRNRIEHNLVGSRNPVTGVTMSQHDVKTEYRFCQPDPIITKRECAPDIIQTSDNDFEGNDVYNPARPNRVRWRQVTMAATNDSGTKGFTQYFTYPSKKTGGYWNYWKDRADWIDDSYFKGKPPVQDGLPDWERTELSGLDGWFGVRAGGTRSADLLGTSDKSANGIHYYLSQPKGSTKHGYDLGGAIFGWLPTTFCHTSSSRYCVPLGTVDRSCLIFTNSPSVPRRKSRIPTRGCSTSQTNPLS
ncbi:MAG: trypsin-like serine protease [Polyangiaceae bacterium]|nr:trypsin-like serine protease [Polyangiaceae bacterium]